MVRCPTRLRTSARMSGGISVTVLLLICVQLDDGREVQVSMPLQAERLVQLLGRRSENHRLTGQTGGLGGQAQVLEHQVSAKAASITAAGRHVFQYIRIGVVNFRTPAASARSEERRVGKECRS